MMQCLSLMIDYVSFSGFAHATKKKKGKREKTKKQGTFCTQKTCLNCDLVKAQLANEITTQLSSLERLTSCFPRACFQLHQPE